MIKSKKVKQSEKKEKVSSLNNAEISELVLALDVWELLGELVDYPRSIHEILSYQEQYTVSCRRMTVVSHIDDTLERGLRASLVSSSQKGYLLTKRCVDLVAPFIEKNLSGWQEKRKLVQHAQRIIKKNNQANK